jgi:aryl-alcohol dehydrogenase-like predicted oxidoreductase
MDAPEMLSICDQFDQASICRSPLVLGMLTGKYGPNPEFPDHDWRDRDSFRNAWVAPVLEKLDDLREALTSGGRTLTQGALAWLWARSERTIPIPGFRTVAQVEENAAAMAFGPLSDDQMQQVDEILGRDSTG